MKKIIVFAVLLSGGISFANAQCPNATAPQAVSTQQAVATGEFKEVALSNLSEAVQTAVKNLAGDTFNVKKLELNAAKELTKVTLASKADASEKVVILDKEGKEVKAVQAPAQK